MKNKIRKELTLNGLNCASCAMKIEDKVNKLEGVSATMNFATKTMMVDIQDFEAKSIDINSIVDNIKKIVVSFEPHVIVEEKKKNREKKENISIKENLNKAETIKILIGFLLFLVPLVFSFNSTFEIGLYFLSYFIVGFDVLKKAVSNIAKGQIFDENFLMAVATIGAFFIGEYPEGIAVMIFYQIGEMFQDMAVDHSRKSIGDLMDIRPDFANVLVGGEIKTVSPEELKIGDIIIVKAGEKIPVDGEVVFGSSMVDTSALTGESMPRMIKAGDKILSGMINSNSILNIKVTSIFEESTVAKILNLIENAGSRKSPTENFITKFARYYTPAVVFIAAAIAILPTVLIEGAIFSDWLYRGLVFLVVSCPCALVISIPLGFFGGIGGAAKEGILFKGSNYLEALNYAEKMVFDKTGTLTKGTFSVVKVKNLSNSISDEEFLKFLAYSEFYSTHPIGISVMEFYKNKIDKSKIENFEEILGYGVKATAEGKEILAGNLKLMKMNEISPLSEEFHSESGTLVHCAIDSHYAGYVVISDIIKEDSKEAISQIKKLGINDIIMLTGDSKDVAQRVSKEIGIEQTLWELLPHEKVENIEKMEAERKGKGKIVFVGDGINDGPSLARADIGIAMGGLGSDAAIEAADIVIMTDEPSKIPLALKFAKRTKEIVWQNIIFAFAVKGIVLLLGASGVATMWEAVFADVGVAIIAIFNSMRVLNFK